MLEASFKMGIIIANLCAKQNNLVQRKFFITLRRDTCRRKGLQ